MGGRGDKQKSCVVRWTGDQHTFMVRNMNGWDGILRKGRTCYIVGGGKQEWKCGQYGPGDIRWVCGCLPCGGRKIDR